MSLTILTTISLAPLIGQTSNPSVTIKKATTISVDDVFKLFANEHQLVFSYSPDVVMVYETFSPTRKKTDLTSFLEWLSVTQEISYTTASYPRILIYREQDDETIFQNNRIRRYGYVQDKLSKEKLIGAIIYDENDKILGITDRGGFYSLSLEKDKAIFFSYVGYETKIIIPNGENDRLDIFLKTKNELETVVVTTSSPKEIIIAEGDQGIMDIEQIQNTVGFLGEINAMQLIRKQSGIQSGAEGQTGLYIRGGSPDQNLLLYNGIPIYEMSHVAGVSSILQADDLQSIELYKNGIPASYGGRLSSVLNIQSKNGNKTHYEANAGLSLSAIHAHIDGPLVKDKVSYNINARQSTVGLYLEPLANLSLDYDDLGVSYYDFSTHVHVDLTANDQISIFGYTGGDRISFDTAIASQNGDDQFLFTDRNNITWNTNLVGVSYERILSDKILAQLDLGSSSYAISSRGSYTSDLINSSQIKRSELEIISSTEIEDQNISLMFDYFFQGFDKVSIGYQYQSHGYRPALLQSSLIRDDEIRQILGEQDPISTKDQAIFVEYKGRSFAKLNWNIGLRKSWFSGDNVSYRNWEPRISLKSDVTTKVTLRASYNGTAQYVHMLTNPGSGFPADLWVPSTDKIPAQTASHYSFNIELKEALLDKITLGYFYKDYEGLIEYTGENDIFYSILNENDPIIFFENKTDWQSRIELGSGTARGFELSIDHAWQRWNFNWNMTLSSSRRIFENLNNGEEFPYRYDRPVDHFMSLGYNINNDWSVRADFSYGSGAAYSLALEQFLTPEGDTILVSDGRNRQRLPAFHHLDVYVSYSKLRPKGTLSLQLGVYNVYNRLNPFYVYQYNDPVREQIRLRQVSLFPLLPSINVNWKFKPQKYRVDLND